MTLTFGTLLVLLPVFSAAQDTTGIGPQVEADREHARAAQTTVADLAEIEDKIDTMQDQVDKMILLLRANRAADAAAAAINKAKVDVEPDPVEPDPVPPVPPDTDRETPDDIDDEATSDDEAEEAPDGA